VEVDGDRFDDALLVGIVGGSARVERVEGEDDDEKQGDQCEDRFPADSSAGGFVEDRAEQGEKQGGHGGAGGAGDEEAADEQEPIVPSARGGMRGILGGMVG